MTSKITGGHTELIFTAKVLNKYNVKYYRCLDTGFIQTEEPFWLDEAYSSAITSLDLGLLHRNILFADSTNKILDKNFDTNKKFLDYAGGYGVFTRLMRDNGYDFYHTDKFCKNLFAVNFDQEDLTKNSTFELATAFELFEHLVNPLEEISKIFTHSENILFSTELVPKEVKNSVDDWWYFAPQTGQHVSFYTRSSLLFIAKKFEKKFYTNGSTLHLFSKNKLLADPFAPPAKEPFLVRKIRKFINKYDNRSRIVRPSLLNSDFEKAKTII